jgi:hypothetical protein
MLSVLSGFSHCRILPNLLPAYIKLPCQFYHENTGETSPKKQKSLLCVCITTRYVFSSVKSAQGNLHLTVIQFLGRGNALLDFLSTYHQFVTPLSEIVQRMSLKLPKAGCVSVLAEFETTFALFYPKIPLFFYKS